MDWDKFMEHLREQEELKKLPVSQQLKQLAANTEESDAVIGTIYVQNPPEFSDRKILNKLLENALLIEECAVMGQGDNELNMLFAVGNLLIGVKYFAYWGSPLSMIRECKVYRFSKEKSLANIDLNEIKEHLFGC